MRKQMTTHNEELVYDQGLVKAVFDEALERAAAIADSYMTIESRAIAEDIRSLKNGNTQ